MFNKKLFNQLVLIIITILFGICPQLSGEWVESNYFGLGNFYFYDNAGYFVQIQESPYVIYFYNRSIIVIDTERGRIRGGIHLDHQFYSGSVAIIPDPESGWNMFYYDSSSDNFGKLHIDPSGQFSNDVYLLKSSEKSSPAVGIPEKHQVWYFMEKILCLNTDDETWNEYDFPLGWDYNFRSTNLFPVFSADYILCTSYGNTIKGYQAFLFNMETGNSKTLVAEDNSFFHKIRDVAEWKNHPGYFIILQKNEIYSLDINSGKIELLIEGFEASSSKRIMQNESGILYFLGNTNLLYILNLEEKTFQTIEFQLEENLYFQGAASYYDKKRDKIIDIIYEDSEVVTGSVNPRLCLINPKTYLIEYLSEPFERIGCDIYLEEDNKFVFISTPDLYVVDLNTYEYKKTIPIEYNAITCEILKGSDDSIMVNNIYGPDFVKIRPDCNREIHNSGINANLVCGFPDGKGCIVGDFLYLSTRYYRNYYDFKYYEFEDGSSRDIEFIDSCNTFLSDSMNDQLIVLSYKDIHFISSDLSIKSWFAPEGLNFTSVYYMFNEEKNTLWLYYYNLDNDDRYFYKLSTKTNSLIDSFIIENEEVTYILHTEYDPSGKYLYFIDKKENGTVRVLVIFDVDKKEIVKRITLQTEIESSSFFQKVIPGIIPVPEKDKLFLWDHYGSWCIDTNTWEILYGESKSNPRAIGSVPGGFYDEQNNQVVLVDSSYDPEGTGSDHRRCLIVNLDTGDIVNEYESPSGSLVHISKDDKIILFLETDGSRINILHLEPEWETPARIQPGTNYIQFGEGDEAKFTINIRNDYDFSQDVTAYMWLYAPDGTMFFFDGISLNMDIKGIPLTLPANLDIAGDILAFTMPAGVPEGFYNINAVLINENGDRGPVGTWNFYVKD